VAFPSSSPSLFLSLACAFSKLNEMAYEAVDLAGVSFSDFVANRKADNSNAGYSFVLRGYVNKWRTDVDDEPGKLNLIQSLNKPTPRGLNLCQPGA
jgi:hypothetical protein